MGKKDKRKEDKRRERQPIIDLEDMRDDTIAVVLNSGMTFKRVHEAGGPTAQTLSKWLYKETRFPRLDTIRATLVVCGYELRVQPKHLLPEDDVVIERLRPTTTMLLPKRERRKYLSAKAVRRSKSRNG